MAEKYGENLEHLTLESEGVSGEQSLKSGYNAAVSQKLNDLTLAKLNATPIETNTSRLAAVPMDKINKIYDDVAHNPVGSLESLDKYDPARVEGLCYGRAMIAHLQALQQGVAKSAIKKVWMVGKMNGPNIKWSYHVATAIRSSTGQWMVIDPFFGKVMTVEEWSQTLQKANGARARFYVTDPGRATLASSKTYTPGMLKDADGGVFNFFSDLLSQFRTDAKQIKAAQTQQ